MNHHWLQSRRRDRAYLENITSRTLLREWLLSLFNDIGVSRLGERNGFYHSGEPGHGRAENRDP